MTSQTVEQSVNQYTVAWNLVDVNEIKEAISKCWTEETTYVDPQNGPVKGFSGLAELISGSYASLPDRKFKLFSEIDYHHNSGRFKWQLTLKDGSTSIGLDYFEYDDQNRITKIVGFFKNLDN